MASMAAERKSKNIEENRKRISGEKKNKSKGGEEISVAWQRGNMAAWRNGAGINIRRAWRESEKRVMAAAAVYRRSGVIKM